MSFETFSVSLGRPLPPPEQTEFSFRELELIGQHDSWDALESMPGLSDNLVALVRAFKALDLTPKKVKLFFFADDVWEGLSRFEPESIYICPRTTTRLESVCELARGINDLRRNSKVNYYLDTRTLDFFDVVFSLVNNDVLCLPLLIGTGLDDDYVTVICPLSHGNIGNFRVSKKDYSKGITEIFKNAHRLIVNPAFTSKLDDFLQFFDQYKFCSFDYLLFVRPGFPWNSVTQLMNRDLIRTSEMLYTLGFGPAEAKGLSYNLKHYEAFRSPSASDILLVKVRKDNAELRFVPYGVLSDSDKQTPRESFYSAMRYAFAVLDRVLSRGDCSASHTNGLHFEIGYSTVGGSRALHMVPYINFQVSSDPDRYIVFMHRTKKLYILVFSNSPETWTPPYANFDVYCRNKAAMNEKIFEEAIQIRMDEAFVSQHVEFVNRYFAGRTNHASLVSRAQQSSGSASSDSNEAPLIHALHEIRVRQEDVGTPNDLWSCVFGRTEDKIRVAIALFASMDLRPSDVQALRYAFGFYGACIHVSGSDAQFNSLNHCTVVGGKVEPSDSRLLPVMYRAYRCIVEELEVYHRTVCFSLYSADAFGALHVHIHADKYTRCSARFYISLSFRHDGTMWTASLFTCAGDSSITLVCSRDDQLSTVCEYILEKCVSYTIDREFCRKMREFRDNVSVLSSQGLLTRRRLCSATPPLPEPAGKPRPMTCVSIMVRHIYFQGEQLFHTALLILKKMILLNLAVLGIEYNEIEAEVPDISTGGGRSAWQLFEDFKQFAPLWPVMQDCLLGDVTPLLDRALEIFRLVTSFTSNVPRPAVDSNVEWNLAIVTHLLGRGIVMMSGAKESINMILGTVPASNFDYMIDVKYKSPHCLLFDSLRGLDTTWMYNYDNDVTCEKFSGKSCEFMGITAFKFLFRKMLGVLLNAATSVNFSDVRFLSNMGIVDGMSSLHPVDRSNEHYTVYRQVFQTLKMDLKKDLNMLRNAPIDENGVPVLTYFNFYHMLVVISEDGKPVVKFQYMVDAEDVFSSVNLYVQKNGTVCLVIGQRGLLRRAELVYISPKECPLLDPLLSDVRVEMHEHGIPFEGIERFDEDKAPGAGPVAPAAGGVVASKNAKRRERERMAKARRREEMAMAEKERIENEARLAREQAENEARQAREQAAALVATAEQRLSDAESRAVRVAEEARVKRENATILRNECAEEIKKLQQEAAEIALKLANARSRAEQLTVTERQMESALERDSLRAARVIENARMGLLNAKETASKMEALSKMQLMETQLSLNALNEEDTRRALGIVRLMSDMDKESLVQGVHLAEETLSDGTTRVGEFVRRVSLGSDGLSWECFSCLNTYSWDTQPRKLICCVTIMCERCVGGFVDKGYRCANGCSGTRGPWSLLNQCAESYPPLSGFDLLLVRLYIQNYLRKILEQHKAQQDEIEVERTNLADLDLAALDLGGPDRDDDGGPAARTDRTRMD